MALDADLLRASFSLVAERSPELTRRFYESFFERYPVVRPMFGANTARQEKKLTDALVAVLDHLDDAAWLAGTLHALGAKHVGYGVRDEMYGLGHRVPARGPRGGGRRSLDRRGARAAWAAALGAIASMMLAGAEAARPRPPRDQRDQAISCGR
jgi:hypothetical protein